MYNANMLRVLKGLVPDLVVLGNDLAVIKGNECEIGISHIRDWLQITFGCADMSKEGLVGIRPLQRDGKGNKSCFQIKLDLDSVRRLRSFFWLLKRALRNESFVHIAPISIETNIKYYFCGNSNLSEMALFKRINIDGSFGYDAYDGDSSFNLNLKDIYNSDVFERSSLVSISPLTRFGISIVKLDGGHLVNVVPDIFFDGWKSVESIIKIFIINIHLYYGSLVKLGVCPFCDSFFYQNKTNNKKYCNNKCKTEHTKYMRGERWLCYKRQKAFYAYMVGKPHTLKMSEHRDIDYSECKEFKSCTQNEKGGECPLFVKYNMKLLDERNKTYYKRIMID